MIRRRRLLITVTERELEWLMQASHMSIYLWRKGRVKDIAHDPLPYRAVATEGGRHRVFFVWREVVEWVKRNRPLRLATIRARLLDESVDWLWC